MAKQISESELMERAKRWLPKGMPEEAIEDVECDPSNGLYDDYGYSYWVYLKDGYLEPENRCHTIHESRLIDVKRLVSRVYIEE